MTRKEFDTLTGWNHISEEEFESLHNVYMADEDIDKVTFCNDLKELSGTKYNLLLLAGRALGQYVRDSAKLKKANEKQDAALNDAAQKVEELTKSIESLEAANEALKGENEGLKIDRDEMLGKLVENYQDATATELGFTHKEIITKKLEKDLLLTECDRKELLVLLK